MYEYIEGRLAGLNPAYAIVESNGIGYQLSISLNTYSGIKDKEHCRLFTHLAIRNEATTPVGFALSHEVRGFGRVAGVPGVSFQVARVVAERVLARSAGPAGILPLGLGGKAVSAGLEIARGVFLVVARLKPLVPGSLVAVQRGVGPADLLHRAAGGLEVGRVGRYDFSVELLGHLVTIHEEGVDPDPVDRRLVRIPRR